MMRQRFSRFVFVVLGAQFLCSCTLLRLKKNVEQHDAHGVIALKVTNLSNSATNYAVALSRNAAGTNEMTGLQVIGQDGLALFLLRLERTYAVGAFSDLNGNGKYDEH